MVSVLAFYSDDPSSIPAEVYNFFCKNIVEKNENKQKEAGVGPFFKKNSTYSKMKVSERQFLKCLLVFYRSAKCMIIGPNFSS